MNKIMKDISNWIPVKWLKENGLWEQFQKTSEYKEKAAKFGSNWAEGTDGIINFCKESMEKLRED